MASGIYQSTTGTPGMEALAYFYYKRDETSRNTPDEILRSLLKQLSQLRDGPLLQPVVKEYKSEEIEGFPSGSLRLPRCLALIIECVNYYSQMSIMIDALDECDRERRDALFDALKIIREESKSFVRIFTSSREIADILLQFDKIPNVRIGATDNAGDIELFVESNRVH
ncbi:hypothetical protein BDD12DRAFT_876476 [Trichophaea hybrida]|nr:hypothetical protein BDD12DRAFT_876476 [Trichophaea hybrida]